MRATLTTLGGCLAVAALSALAVAPAPSYDPWSWLLWGRELAHGTLHTADGPSFKPLPVAVCALLSPFGAAAPALWVIVARTGALLAVVLAFRLARRLAGGAVAAGLLAAAGVVLCGAFVQYAAEGIVTGWVLALGLAGLEAWRAGRLRLALACAVGCCLLQVDAWPFAAAFGAWLWLRRPEQRGLVAAAAVAVPVLWIVPEWLGSGDPLRSGSRARVPNLGQPALADVPGVASVRDAASLLLWPLWVGVVVLGVAGARALVGGRARRSPTELTSHVPLGIVSPGDGSGWFTGLARAGTRLMRLGRAGVSVGEALAVVGAGLAWVLVVAGMAQVGGFSGEERYALPGAALVGVGGAVGLVLGVRLLAGRVGRPRGAGLWRLGVERAGGGGSRRLAVGAVAALAVALLAAGVVRLDRVAEVPGRQAEQWRLAGDLVEAVELAGGREAVLGCGTPYVGPLRGPLLAYRLDVAKRVVRPDDAPVSPGVAFRAAPREGRRVLPAVGAAFETVAVAGDWTVARACRVRMP